MNYLLHDKSSAFTSTYQALYTMITHKFSCIDIFVENKETQVIISVTECAAFIPIKRECDLISNAHIIIHDTEHVIYADQNQCQITTGMPNILYDTNKPFELLNMYYRSCYFIIPLSETLVKNIIDNDIILHATVMLKQRFVDQRSEYIIRNEQKPFIPESAQNYPYVPIYFNHSVVTLRSNGSDFKFPVGPSIYNIFIKCQESDTISFQIGGNQIPVHFKWLPLKGEWAITDFIRSKPLRLNHLIYHNVSIIVSNNSVSPVKSVQVMFNQNLLEDTMYEGDPLTDHFDGFQLNYKDYMIVDPES